ncbi:hypothetical protein V6N13_057909 [Hibiscus sabdariffa]
MAGKPQPVKVLYCTICSLPAEYCEFGPDFEKCKPWLINNAPELYPHLLKGTASSSKQEDVKRLPGGKIKKKGRTDTLPLSKASKLFLSSRTWREIG